jgi:hypothetical protein
MDELPAKKLRPIATRVRVLAQAKIVEAFRAQIGGYGPGPSEADLQSFARAVRFERICVERLSAPIYISED